MRGRIMMKFIMSQKILVAALAVVITAGTVTGVVLADRSAKEPC